MLALKFNFVVTDLTCLDTSVAFLKRSETWANIVYIVILFQLQGACLSFFCCCEK